MQSETSKLIKRINEQIRQFNRKGLTGTADYRKLIYEFKNLGMGHKGLQYSYTPEGTPIIRNTAENRKLIENDPIIKNYLSTRDKIKATNVINRANEYAEEAYGIKKLTVAQRDIILSRLDKTHELIELTKNALYETNSKYAEWLHKSENLTASEHQEIMTVMETLAKYQADELAKQKTIGSEIKLDQYKKLGII